MGKEDAITSFLDFLATPMSPGLNHGHSRLAAATISHGET